MVPLPLPASAEAFVPLPPPQAASAARGRARARPVQAVRRYLLLVELMICASVLWQGFEVRECFRGVGVWGSKRGVIAARADGAGRWSRAGRGGWASAP